MGLRGRARLCAFARRAGRSRVQLGRRRRRLLRLRRLAFSDSSLSPMASARTSLHDLAPRAVSPCPHDHGRIHPRPLASLPPPFCRLHIRFSYFLSSIRLLLVGITQSSLGLSSRAGPLRSRLGTIGPFRGAELLLSRFPSREPSANAARHSEELPWPAFVETRGRDNSALPNKDNSHERQENDATRRCRAANRR